MDKPLVSCVCVTYDRPYLINELVYCFLMQDYKNKELIILNDQEDVKYIYTDSKVKIFNIPTRFPSLGTKRNYSRKLTNGEYIFIMDDDDIYYSNHISRLLKFHQENDDCDVVGNNMCHYSQDNKDIQKQINPLAFNGACFKKEYYLNNEFPNEKSCAEDLDFIRNAKITKLDDGETSWHYRWGLDAWHISGMGGDGQESYNIVTKKTYQYIEITKNVTKKGMIMLKPTISNEVKEYYR